MEKTNKIKTKTKVQNKHGIIVKAMCKLHQIQQPQEEYKFLGDRKFRFDFAWTDKLLAMEVEGGVWVNGRHTRGSGFVKDMEKYNLATINGWRILRFTPQQLKNNETYNFIQKALMYEE